MDNNIPTVEEIYAKQTSRGGWLKEDLQRWGIGWPPPKGWKNRLVKQAQLQTIHTLRQEKQIIKEKITGLKSEPSVTEHNNVK